MIALITVIHVIVCVFLIGVVLLQHGKSADVAATFGGMGSQTAFGPRSAASALSRVTTIAAVIFMLTSFTLAILSTRNAGGASSVLDGTKSAPVQQAPAQQQPAPEPQPVTPSR